MQTMSAGEEGCIFLFCDLFHLRSVRSRMLSFHVFVVSVKGLFAVVQRIPQNGDSSFLSLMATSIMHRRD
jgi:hypothetical protein